MIAYCFADGVIHIGRKEPEGSIVIATAPKQVLQKACDALARWSYPSKPGAGDSVPLVPGIPEAKDQTEGLNALLEFRKRFRRYTNKGKGND